MTAETTRTHMLRHHAALLDDTATRLGMDLQEAAIRGALGFEEISEAVLRCTQCSQPAACAAWQKTQEAEAVAPQYCRNKPLLQRLQAAPCATQIPAKAG